MDFLDSIKNHLPFISVCVLAAHSLYHSDIPMFPCTRLMIAFFRTRPDLKPGRRPASSTLLPHTYINIPCFMSENHPDTARTRVRFGIAPEKPG